MKPSHPPCIAAATTELGAHQLPPLPPLPPLTPPQPHLLQIVYTALQARTYSPQLSNLPISSPNLRIPVPRHTQAQHPTGTGIQGQGKACRLSRGRCVMGGASGAAPKRFPTPMQQAGPKLKRTATATLLAYLCCARPATCGTARRAATLRNTTQLNSTQAVRSFMLL